MRPAPPVHPGKPSLPFSSVKARCGPSYHTCCTELATVKPCTLTGRVGGQNNCWERGVGGRWAGGWSNRRRAGIGTVGAREGEMVGERVGGKSSGSLFGRWGPGRDGAARASGRMDTKHWPRQPSPSLARSTRRGETNCTRLPESPDAPTFWRRWVHGICRWDVIGVDRTPTSRQHYVRGFGPRSRSRKGINNGP